MAARTSAGHSASGGQASGLAVAFAARNRRPFAGGIDGHEAVAAPQACGTQPLA